MPAKTAAPEEQDEVEDGRLRQRLQVDHLRVEARQRRAEDCRGAEPHRGEEPGKRQRREQDPARQIARLAGAPRRRAGRRRVVVPGPGGGRGRCGGERHDQRRAQGSEAQPQDRGRLPRPAGEGEDGDDGGGDREGAGAERRAPGARKMRRHGPHRGRGRREEAERDLLGERPNRAPRRGDRCRPRGRGRGRGRARGRGRRRRGSVRHRGGAGRRCRSRLGCRRRLHRRRTGKLGVAQSSSSSSGWGGNPCMPVCGKQTRTGSGQATSPSSWSARRREARASSRPARSRAAARAR